ncbi:MAG: AEC family transporter [Gammaproteobacteria bacterium]|uniref:AEC family transporter n=1 Tax=Pseudomaricurvus alcaniphilus TaxID=1166482 RepID=UPI0014092639|nr:AEC family transporter [Pseudomaricurvus alcaniphilus]MBR9913070.1 AEC family transporter [Gammaproteobacteria bacterium]NHN36110.1 AEC family transporter [Pseudomaricurvus alcaniphilus]
MEEVILLVVPIFGVMALGYLVGKLGILGQESTHGLNAFVYYVAMPIMLFRAMANTDIVALWDINFIAIVVVPQFLVHAVYLLVAMYVFGRGFKEAMLAALAASWGNTVYMGFPLAQTVLGEAAIAAVVIIAVVQTFIFLIGTLLLLDISDNRRGSTAMQAARRSFISFIKNPAMVAALLGMCFSANHWSLPPMLDSFTAMLAPAAAPCALFAIGLFLTTTRLNKGLGEISVITLVKLLVSPALVLVAALLLLRWGIEVDTLWVKAAILLAATPTGTLVFVIAQKYHAAEDCCSGAILLSSVVSVLTIAVLIGWL